ncbi:actin-like protein 10 [Phascolarctos cinereus]|uniref:Actin-like protein 10 n=1 Tax=Phascolarctos cinereus TaxID=38626 RepID=A0A6P5LCQ3_PHACI|nr:actin-like protein 10 [Phascolarctos cinereus]
MGSIAVVIDNGSGFTKVGFAGEKKPRFILKTASCLPNCATAMRGMPCSLDALGTAPGRSRLLKHGVIVDWESMESLWRHLFACGLKTSPKNWPVLMSDSPTSLPKNREKVAELMFETFSVPAFHMASTGLLALCSGGSLSGLAVEAGAGVCHATPIYAGHMWHKATFRLDMAGAALSKYFHGLLLEACPDPRLQALPRLTVTMLKKRCCYISLDYEAALRAPTLQLPSACFCTADGCPVTLTDECFRCPKPLFWPSLLGHSSPGLSSLAFQALQAVPETIRPKLAANVLVAGGSTLFPGFPQRLRLELKALYQKQQQWPAVSSGTVLHPQLVAKPERGLATWVGGSLAGSLHSFHRLWVTHTMYEEQGAGCVHVVFD